MTRFTQAELSEAIRSSSSWAETLRRLGYRSGGGNWRTLQKYAAAWQITTAHFDAGVARARALRAARQPRALTEVLVENSTYPRKDVKRRLFAEGIKQRQCEACGQDENWRGRRLALILDHANGVPNDHRIENLRILCPNCAATLETHCGNKNRVPKEPRECLRCGTSFYPRSRSQRYCSSACGCRHRNRPQSGIARPASRKVPRPDYETLMRELAETSYRAVGRKYGVSDNAVRKWMRFYERAAEREARGVGA